MKSSRLKGLQILSGWVRLLIFLTALGLVLSSASRAGAQSIFPSSASSSMVSSHPVDIVFDLDWTLINPTTEEMVQIDGKDVIRFQNEIYRFTDHAIEVLMELHQQPGVRISFFSGGSRERNEFVISELYRRLHLLEGASRFQPYKILSSEDLTLVSEDKNLRFTERNKKDLSRFFHIKSAVLIDDVPNFTMTGQRKNNLWLGPTYKDIPRFEMVPTLQSRGETYLPPNQSEWLRDRNKLLPIRDALIRALQSNQRQPGTFLDQISSAKGLMRKCSLLFSE